MERGDNARSRCSYEHMHDTFLAERVCVIVAKGLPSHTTTTTTTTVAAYVFSLVN